LVWPECVVLQLVVWILIVLACGGLLLALMGLWMVTYLVEAASLLGVPSQESTRLRRPARHADEETLLTDSATSPGSDQTMITQHDESIIAVSEEKEEANEASLGLRDALRDHDALQPTATPVASFAVQVQQVQVNEVRSLNSNGGSKPSSSRTSKPPSSALPDNVLSAYFNLSVLLLILYFGFSLLLLAQRQQVADYVHTHALTHGIAPIRHSHGIHHYGTPRVEGEVEDPESVADVLKTQLGAYLAVMGVCALFSSKLMTFGTLATWIIQRRKPATQQAYIMTQLITGVSGHAYIHSIFELICTWMFDSHANSLCALVCSLLCVRCAVVCC
jgi:hypothetical protein